jgi:hypothetical protein
MPADLQERCDRVERSLLVSFDELPAIADEAERASTLRSLEVSALELLRVRRMARMARGEPWVFGDVEAAKTPIAITVSDDGAVWSC